VAKWVTCGFLTAHGTERSGLGSPEASNDAGWHVLTILGLQPIPVCIDLKWGHELATPVHSTGWLVLILHCCGTAEPSSSGAGSQHRKLSKVEELMKKDLEAKARREAAAAGPSGRGHESGGSSSSRAGRVDHWLHPGIIVKVMSKALKEHGYYKQKVRWAGEHA
jgi:hypothetical protein